MTEEILQAAIMQLKAKATENYALIKDAYHRPATAETTNSIVSHAIALSQLEGAMITLQKYSTSLAQQTEDEEKSNTPEEPAEVEVEPNEDASPKYIGSDELEKRSSTYRKSQKHKKKTK